MHFLAGLLLTVGLASALPEPVPVPAPADDSCAVPASKKCHNKARSYCSSILATTTTTEIAPTSTVLDLPCVTPATLQRRAVEARAPKVRVPPCLRSVAANCGTTALPSACSQLGFDVEPTSTVTERSTPTATATAFHISFTEQDVTYYGRQYTLSEGRKTFWTTDPTQSTRFTLASFGDNTCRIFELDDDDSAVDYANIDTGVDSRFPDDVYWYTEDTSTSMPLLCSVVESGSGDTLQCVSGDHKYENAYSRYSNLELATEVRYGNRVIGVSPVVDDGLVDEE